MDNAVGESTRQALHQMHAYQAPCPLPSQA